jgi:hypothetical protein
MSIGKAMTIVAHALAIWALCFAAIGAGMAVTTLSNALIIHAIAAPLIAAAVSLVYFRRYNYTAPLATAALFVAIIMGMDLLVVALLINRSLAMFASALGTWIPFALIFASTALTGTLVRRSS